MLDSNCAICKIQSNDRNSIILINGFQYHCDCYENLIKNIYEKKLLISELNKDILLCENKLSEANTLLYKLKILFGGKVISIDTTSERIRSLTTKNELAETELLPIINLLRSLYDYWPETPPDWEERKNLVRNKSGNCCEMCLSSGNVEKHVHHKVPVSKGGSHCIGNLQYLCVKCHSKAHHGRNVATTNKVITEKNRPVFSDRLELIKYAIEHKLIIHFQYMKYEGEKSKRSIRPSGLKQKGQSLCVEGHCYLRNANRIFAIRRMEGVKIVDSP